MEQQWSHWIEHDGGECPVPGIDCFIKDGTWESEMAGPGWGWDSVSHYRIPLTDYQRITGMPGREELPEWAGYVAQDSNSEWKLFSQRPGCGDSYWTCLPPEVGIYKDNRTVLGSWQHTLYHVIDGEYVHDSEVRREQAVGQNGNNGDHYEENESELTWLARNVSKWHQAKGIPDGHKPFTHIRKSELYSYTLGYGKTRENWFTRPQWQAERERLGLSTSDLSAITSTPEEEEAFNAMEEKQQDMVNHPPHYTQGGIECIEAIRAALTEEEFRGYCKGAALKYLWRERHKGGDESMRKAVWYINKAVSVKNDTCKGV